MRLRVTVRTNLVPGTRMWLHPESGHTVSADGHPASLEFIEDDIENGPNPGQWRQWYLVINLLEPELHQHAFHFRLRRQNPPCSVRAEQPVKSHDGPPFVVTRAMLARGEAAFEWDHLQAMRNQTPTVSWLELVQMVVMTILLIPIIRLLLAGVCLLFAVVWFRLVACVSSPSPEHGLSFVVRLAFLPVHIALRMVLFCFGFLYIREDVRIPGISSWVQRAVLSGVGTPRIIVSNHTGWIENLYWGSRFAFGFVAKKGVDTLPVVGAGLGMLGPILVDRADPKSNHNARRRINEWARSANANTTHLIIYPTGTSFSQRYMLQFKTGAFAAGVPVQPVLITFPFRRLDVTWESSVFFMMYRMCCQFSNTMRVTYLPPAVPSREEIEDPRRFADAVRRAMADEVRRQDGECVMSELDATDYVQSLQAVYGPRDESGAAADAVTDADACDGGGGGGGGGLGTADVPDQAGGDAEQVPA